MNGAEPGIESTMPVTTEIDTKAGVVVNTISGALTRSTIHALDDVLRHPDFRPGMGIVWDVRGGAVEDLSSDDVRYIAEYGDSRIEERGRGRAAIVVSEDLAYGLGRMLEGYAGERSMEREIFRDFDEAVRWASGASLENGEDG